MSQPELEILQGTIGAVVFQNYENGYAVLRLACDNGQTVTVVGTIPMPNVGEKLMVTGKWGSHPGYGKQFEAEFLERLMPQTTTDILTYLSSRAVKGIGPKTAARIVQMFGDQTLVVMEREPERLALVSGISDAKARQIGETFRLQVGMRQLMEFFALHQLPAELAVRTYKKYGQSAMDLLYDDPYLLAEEEMDALFGAIDRFAISLGVSADDPRRMEAGILFELRYNLNAGHTFLPKDKLIAATATLLNLEPEDVKDALERLSAHGQIITCTMAGICVCYLPALYDAECYCAKKLLALSKETYEAPDGLKNLLLSAAQAGNVEYSVRQNEAIARACTTGLLVITGGPGTGKTTLLKGVLRLYRALGISCALAAPTGRAAKRLTEVTGQEAATIHRLLEATVDPHTGDLFFKRDSQNPLNAKAVIVDEMSMVDVRLLYSLLSALPKGCRLILVGDADQLPPVGPGFPLQDILRSKALPVVQLTEIFRQAQESLIVMNAHRVNQGQMPELRNVKSDFFFLPVRSEEELAKTVVGLCSTRLPNKMGIAPEQIQVLSPTKKGGAGTVNLNGLLQNSLNPAAPGKKERRFGSFLFREGDRVMQIRNNYDILWTKVDGSAVGTGVFNGDIGTVTTIDMDMQTLSVLFDDRMVEYEFTQLNELEPAFAMTVHKSQGSEYRAVVLTAWNGSPYLLSRSILYTAITRAREILIIVGQEQTIGAMVENAKVSRRYTGLKLRLEGKAEK